MYVFISILSLMNARNKQNLEFATNTTAKKSREKCNPPALKKKLDSMKMLASEHFPGILQILQSLEI